MPRPTWREACLAPGCQCLAARHPGVCPSRGHLAAITIASTMLSDSPSFSRQRLTILTTSFVCVCHLTRSFAAFEFSPLLAFGIFVPTPQTTRGSVRFCAVRRFLHRVGSGSCRSCKSNACPRAPVRHPTPERGAASGFHQSTQKRLRCVGGAGAAPSSKPSPSPPTSGDSRTVRPLSWSFVLVGQLPSEQRLNGSVALISHTGSLGCRPAMSDQVLEYPRSLRSSNSSHDFNS